MIRKYAVAVALLLTASPATAAGLSIDNSAVGSAKSANSVSSAPLATHGPADLVACSHAEWQNPGLATWDIVSVTDTAGLTWSRRGKTVPMLGGRNSAWNGMGCWWANSPTALGAVIVTMTWAPGPVFDGSTMTVFAVAGSANPTSPWDPNASLPLTATSTTNGLASIAGLATMTPNDLIIGVVGSGDFVGWSPGYVGTSFTGVNGIPMVGATGWSSIAVEAMPAGLPLTNQTVGWVAPSNGWVMIADALSVTGGTAPPPPPPPPGGCTTATTGEVQYSSGVLSYCNGTAFVAINLPAGPPGPQGNPGAPGVCPVCTGGGGGPVNLQTGVTGILPIANGGNGTATPSLTAGANVTIAGTWPNLTISSTGGGGGGGGGGPLSMKIVQPPALNVISANQMQAAALDYMAITDAAAQVNAGPVPITVQAPGLADVQVWTHGALNIHLTNNGSGTFTGTLDLSHEPNGPILVGYYGFDQVAPLIPNTELVGKYLLFVNGGASAVPPFPAAAAGMTLAFDEEFATFDVMPCVDGSYPCVPTSTAHRYFANDAGEGDFGDAAFEHCDWAAQGGTPSPDAKYPNCPYTLNNGFLRIRMTKSGSYNDPYGFGRTWYGGLFSTADTVGHTLFNGTTLPVLGDGYYEAKILFPDGGGPDGPGTAGSSISGGTWGAFWMLTVQALHCPAPIGACDPKYVTGNDELDIDEQYGKFPSWITSGGHVYGTNIGTGIYGYHSQPGTDTPVLLPVKDFTWDFHRFGLLIKNGTAQLYIDDVALGVPNIIGLFPGLTASQINWVLLVNLALGAGWPENAPPALYYDQWIKDIRYFH
jgi:hypothetical protein